MDKIVEQFKADMLQLMRSRIVEWAQQDSLSDVIDQAMDGDIGELSDRITELVRETFADTFEM